MFIIQYFSENLAGFEMLKTFYIFVNLKIIIQAWGIKRYYSVRSEFVHHYTVS